MSDMLDWGRVAQGDQLPELQQTATLATSVTYAGASGDFNPLHFDESFAADVSPTGSTIAHGMYSMGLVSRLVTDWAGGPQHVAKVQVRFTRPWPLNTEATFGGSVSEVDGDVVTVSVWGKDHNGKAMLRGSATVRRV